MKKITFLFAVLVLFFNSVSGQSVFTFETAVDNGDNVTETIDGITVTATGGVDFLITDGGGYAGSTANVIFSPSQIASVTFVFSEAVDVNSILAMEGAVRSADYTFTPTGGENSPVMASLVASGGESVASVDLNWTGVTSFTVTTSDVSGSEFAFDNLSVSPNSYVPPTIFEFETATDNGDNVTETIDGITVTATGGADFLITDGGGYAGSTANVIFSPSQIASVTFVFSEAVDVNSILAMEGAVRSANYTFTPTGGENSPVMTSLVASGGESVASVDLNWTGVTSFTVTTSDVAGSYFAFDDLSVSPNTYVPPAPTIFEFETATDNGDNVTETIDGILLTVSGSPDIRVQNLSGYKGSSGNIVNSFAVVPSLTFTFDQAVNVNSILAMEGNNYSTDYTFTPTGGSNAPVTVSVPGDNSITADLNWTGVTGFTVTTSDGAGSAFLFDNVFVSDITLSVATEQRQNVIVYPNPVEHILYIKNITGLESVEVYNYSGQRVLQSKAATIDVSNLSQGIYLLQIHTREGIETKKIIKR